MAVGIVFLFLVMVGYAKLTDRWNTNLPKQVYLDLVPKEHPVPGQQ
jgi:hypothetical protein